MRDTGKDKIELMEPFASEMRFVLRTDRKLSAADAPAVLELMEQGVKPFPDYGSALAFGMRQGLHK